MKTKKVLFNAAFSLMVLFAFAGVRSQTPDGRDDDNDQTIDDRTPQIDSDSDEIDERELDELDPWFFDLDEKKSPPEEEKIKDIDIDKSTDNDKAVDRDKKIDKEKDDDRDILEESLPDNK